VSSHRTLITDSNSSLPVYSVKSDTVYGSSTSLLSPSAHRSVITDSNSSLPVYSYGPNVALLITSPHLDNNPSFPFFSIKSDTVHGSSTSSAGDVASRTSRSSWNSDYRSSISSMPSLATISHDDDDFRSSFASVVSLASFSTQRSSRAVSPPRSPTRGSVRGLRMSFMRDDILDGLPREELAGTTLDELPGIQLPHRHDPIKEQKRWDCIGSPGLDITSPRPTVPTRRPATDSIPIFSTRYSLTIPTPMNINFGDGADMTPIVPGRQDFELTPPNLSFPTASNGRIHLVPPPSQTVDTSPQAARRRSSDSSAKTASWAGSSVTSSDYYGGQRRSSNSILLMPSVAEGGSGLYGRPASGMAAAASVVAAELCDYDEIDLPLKPPSTVRRETHGALSRSHSSDSTD